MRGISTSKSKILVIDAFILIFCIIGIFNVVNKADLPLNIKISKGKLTVDKINYPESKLKKGDSIFSLQSVDVRSKEEIEIFLDGKKPGEEVNVSVVRSDELISEKVTLVNFYSTLYVIIASIVGTSFFIVAVIVLLKCENFDLGLVFHWSFIFTAMIIMMTWGNFSILPLGLGKLTRAGFHLGYIFAPLFFLRFSILFPSHIKFNTNKIIKVLYILATSLFLILTITFLVYVRNEEIEAMRTYIMTFDISSVFTVLLTLSAVIVFIHTYTSSPIESDRKKLRWIILGFLIGPLGYLFFWVIPTRIWNNPILPEEVVLLLVAFVPVTFGIAIIKYRLMNIDLILNRSIVYTAVISVLLLIYIGIISAVAKIINSSDSEIASIIAAVTIALLFQPAKSRAQKFVDKKFFRIAYDYRMALNRFNSSTREIINERELLVKTIELIDSIIPVSNLGIFSFTERTNHIKLKEHKNLDHLIDKEIEIDPSLNLSSIIPISFSNVVEPGTEVREEEAADLAKISAKLLYYIKSTKYMGHGLLTLGEKKSGRKFSAEDLDLLNIISNRLSLTLDRIKLQREVIKEHLETERLEELNKLKSFFVSSVSHDLKTPLTSIRLFAERLKTSKNLGEEKINEYLEIIEGESNRLTRLINNVLDYSKIERGIQKYNLQKINLIKVVKEVIHSLEYQFKMNKFVLETKFNEAEIIINADKDAVSEALVNLLSNAMKYSHSNKHIEVYSYRENNFAILEVKDRGEGIDPKEINNIFEPFFRVKHEKINKSGGAGLGLAIVKHIMDGHNGKVAIESALGEGSKFSLLFPIGTEVEKSIHN